jgi:catechol 2,3-dioxygenase-like lactoylglutathione lyase family enzyme
MALPVTFDHCVVHVSDWERSNAFYRDVLGAELVRRPHGWAYRFGAAQLNLHGPGFHPAEVARLPVQPGNSDLCFEWSGPIADAIDYLARCRVAIHAGPSSVLGPGVRAPAFISATPTARCSNSFPMPKLEAAHDDPA